MGQTAENLVINSNCESFTGWTSAHSGSGYSVSLSASEKVYGQKSFAYASSTTGNGYYRSYRNISLEAGTYTFSAYVKTDNVVSGSDGGAYIVLGGAESEKLTGTSNTAIQNGWRRVSVTKTFSTATTVQIKLRFANASGNAYFDCLQLERGEVPSDYNLIHNGGMTLSEGWSSAPNATAAGRGNVMKVDGDISAYNFKSQTVSMYIPAGTTLMLSGWGKADSVPTGEDGAGHLRTFRVVASITYADSTKKDWATDFNPYISSWQFSAAAIVPEKDVTSITVLLSYDFNGNTAYFDDISLTVEPVQTYKYDELGNLVSTVNDNGNESFINYDTDNLIDVTDFTNTLGENYKYEYISDSTGESRHILSKVSKVDAGDSVLQSLEYTYDAYGNTTGSILSSPGITGIVKSSAQYSGNGNFLASVTDSLGGITSYGYSGTKLLSYVENANSARTGYLYDSRNRSTGVYLDRDEDGVADTNEEKVQYTYTGNRLTGITTATTAYTLVYDSFGNMTEVKAGNETLATYTYRSGNGKLTRMTYGSGDYEDYIYDKLDRLISVCYNGVATYTLAYNSDGALYECADAKSGITHTYEYDGLGRLIRAWQTNTATGVRTLGVENIYDSYGRADKSAYVIGDKTLSYDLTYKADSNLVSGIKMPDSSSQSAIGYTYDSFDRLTAKQISMSSLHNIREQYGYYGYTSGGTAYTTPLVSSLALMLGNSASTVYTYTYDTLGNILTVRQNGALKLSYEYDELNQLVRENNAYANTTVLYDYDKAGNITVKSKLAYTTGTAYIVDGAITAYGYSSSEWKDRLTSYGGTAISYDSLGNPTNWRGGITDICWDGKKLTTLSKDIFGISMSYNADGIRTRKYCVEQPTLSSVLHQYTLDGTTILKETVTGAQSYTNYYFYDENGSIAGFEYNGTLYYFQKNIQGDIIRICNANGVVVTEYTYDAWGKLLATTGSLASTVGARNPFRYRGYYYDDETGLYYLQSRYYDPEVGRFISADSYASTGQGIIGNNMFAYCGNNPVMRIDPTGQFWLTALIVTAIVVVCVAGLTGCSPSQTDTRSDIANSNTLLDKSAEELSSLDPNSYNCYGNGIGKQKNTDPTGYKRGDSTEKAFEAVVNDLGSNNVRRLDSIDSPIGDDEFRVAMKCGPSDYHFIRQLRDGTWYNKSGTATGLLIPENYITDGPFGDGNWYAYSVEYGLSYPVYTYETIYFAVKVWR